MVLYPPNTNQAETHSALTEDGLRPAEYLHETEEITAVQLSRMPSISLHGPSDFSSPVTMPSRRAILKEKGQILPCRASRQRYQTVPSNTPGITREWQTVLLNLNVFSVSTPSLPPEHGHRACAYLMPGITQRPPPKEKKKRNPLPAQLHTEKHEAR